MCNSDSFHSTSFKFFIVIIHMIHTMKMWTSYFGEIWIQNGRLAAILLFSETKVCVICNCQSFHSTLLNLCTVIEHTLKMCTSYFEQIWIQNGRPAAIFLWNVQHSSKCSTFHHWYSDVRVISIHCRVSGWDEVGHFGTLKKNKMADLKPSWIEILDDLTYLWSYNR